MGREKFILFVAHGTGGEAREAVLGAQGRRAGARRTDSHAQRTRLCERSGGQRRHVGRRVGGGDGRRRDAVSDWDRTGGNKSIRATDTSQEQDDDDDANQEDSSKTEGRERGRRGGGGDVRVGTVVINCDKGDCGRHTERGLVDFKIHIIDMSYLKATRKKKRSEAGRM